MYGVICRIGSQLSHYCFWQTLIQTDRALRKKVPRIKSKRILTGHCTLCADHLTDLNICYSFFSIRDTERPFHQNRGIKNYHLKVLLYCLLLNYINLNKDHLHHEIPSFFSSLMYIRYSNIKILSRTYWVHWRRTNQQFLAPGDQPAENHHPNLQLPPS